MPPLNPAHGPRGHMVPDCSRSGLVAQPGQDLLPGRNGVPRRTPLAFVGQAKFRAAGPAWKRHSVVKEAGLKEQGSPKPGVGGRGARPGKQLTLECAPKKWEAGGKRGGVLRGGWHPPLSQVEESGSEPSVPRAWGPPLLPHSKTWPGSPSSLLHLPLPSVTAKDNKLSMAHLL